MNYPAVIHHGAQQGVTGSCHQLHLDPSQSLLIDCGMFQGIEAQRRVDQGLPGSAIEFAIDTLKVLIITHVHADHVGRLPQLHAAGFNGPIICSEASARLLPLMLEDALKLQFGPDDPQISRYLELISRHIIAVPFDHWFTVVDTAQVGCRVRLQRAGHVLGAAYVECDVDYPMQARNQRIVFSGDIGSSHTPILADIKSPERADLLILESTYGDRLHEDRATRQSRLEAIIDRALADHGTVLIPAFSLGRTQELLYEIEEIVHRKALKGVKPGDQASGASLPVNWPQLPVILDSPLAQRLTRIYQEFADGWDEEASERLAGGRNPLDFRQLITLDSHAKHMQTVNYLASTGRPAIVIAGQGMCAGGRIVDYLKAMLGDPRHNVVFIGYQAKGTPGATIQKHGPEGGYVELDRQRYTINAGVHTIGGYSAHADQRGLVEFVMNMDVLPGEIRLVHGEAPAKSKLGQILQSQYAARRQPLVLG